MNGGFDSPFAMPGMPAGPPPMQYAAPSNRGMPARAPGTPSLLAQQQQQQQQQIVPPRPIIRAQRGEDPSPAPPQTAARPTPLSIPSPEELGVARSTDNVAVDWTTVHNQLNRMGASCFHLERLANGGCRITCLLPGGQQGRSRRIEAEAASEAEAIRATLAKADEWASRR